MFTWIPIHEEAAKRLLGFKDSNHELVTILSRMKDRGLITTKVADQDSDGKAFQLEEIDPFTFLANFNRGTRDSNRRGLWQALKEEWSLSSEVPQDFDGLPLANAQNSWLMPYAKDRSPEHVPLLWRFFEHIMAADPASLDDGLMQQCLRLPQVGMAMLTMGMFWSCPKKWVATDGKNLGFAKTKGLGERPENASEYKAWLPRIRALTGGDGVEFSRQAHLWATSKLGHPFDKLFGQSDPGPVLDLFAEVIRTMRGMPGFKEELLVTTLRREPMICINYADWRIFAYSTKDGPRFELALPSSVSSTPECTSGDPFRKETSSGKTSLYSISPGLLSGSESPWLLFLEHLKGLVRDLANYRRSPYHRWGIPAVTEMIMDQALRETHLKNGIMPSDGELPPTASRRYWLIAPGESARFWKQWLDQNIAAIGWPQIGDLLEYQSKEAMIEALQVKFPDRNQSGVALMLWNFAKIIQEGDVIFAKLGRTEIIGWGMVQGSYSHDNSEDELPNLLPVEWAGKQAVKIPESWILPMKTLTEITDNHELLKFLSGNFPGIPGLESDVDDPTLTDSVVDSISDGVKIPPYSHTDALEELFMSRDSLEHILEQLKRKKNIILQGAPGVGKTFIAKRLAWLLLRGKDESAVEMVQFHQSYTYEDFIQGLRPTKDGHFAVKDGCFYRLCRKALANPQRDYFLVIDEINRGNLSKILGELMMLIETDKRGETLTLAYSEEPFTVPPNLYLIGTMNTADRSLSLVDYALRRRFAFLTLDPGFSESAFSTHLGNHGITPAQTRHIIQQMEALNQEIEKDDANLGKGYRIGHSFFTPSAPVSDFQKWFQAIIRYEIMPLLEEYWIDDPKLVQQFRITLAEGIP